MVILDLLDHKAQMASAFPQAALLVRVSSRHRIMIMTLNGRWFLVVVKLDHRALLVRLVRKVRQAPMEQLVLKVYLAPLALKAQQAPQVRQAQQGQLVPKAPRVIRDKLVLRGHLEQRDR
jgi:hypothetical protein